MGDGGWEMVDGGWWMEDGRWVMGDGGCVMRDRRWEIGKENELWKDAVSMLRTLTTLKTVNPKEIKGDAM
ncbi:MAG: hypothetical protein NVV59_09880 [Chitinophagaceae bacterium]|nr:hypothetical protein [Chitinophagaceae bacterium]